MTPRRILVAGWLLLVLYAHPGYMSYDSVLQLLQARAGEYTGGHPPLMGVLWGAVDALIPGPLGMLLVQVTCFMAGAYLLLARVMSRRAAAFATVAVSLAPPLSAVLAVIWKDAQMIGYLALGTALLLSPRRGVRLSGLALLFLATAMRYNALAVTFPIVVLLFQWVPEQRWFRRYPIAVAAWLAITLLAGTINNQFASDTDRLHVWHESVALLDITGTLRYANDLDETALRADLAGTPLLATGHPQQVARASHDGSHLDEITRSSFGTGTYVPALWITTRTLFALPKTADERAAISGAWRKIVLGNFGGYLAYRWQVTRERIHLGDAEIPSAAYVWFADVGNFRGSSEQIEHSAVPSKLQKLLQPVMLWLGSTALFRPWIYIALLVVLLAFAFRDRLSLALVLSGLANEVALFVIAPTIDYRYSVWLVATTLLVLAIVIARRAGSRPHSDSHDESDAIHA